MNICCVGLSHQTASLEARERFAVQPQDLPLAVRRAVEQAGVREAVVVSTCNRVEWYLAMDDPACDVLTVLRSHVSMEDGDHGHLYRHDIEAGARHLFRVVSGLESMVLGETEILGQVKKAYAVALEQGTTSLVLNRLFQQAFSVAKQVRSSTAITRGSISVGSVAVDLAEKIFGQLDRCRVLVLGAGETSERTLRTLASRGVQTVLVSNRSHDRAVTLAGSIGGRAVPFDQWENELHEVDIVVSSTAAPHYVVTRERIEPVMRQRPERPLFLIDIAVPRDVDPAVNHLDGVYLYDMDSLENIARQSREIRLGEMGRCERLIEHQVRQFMGWREERLARGMTDRDPVSREGCRST